VVAFIVYHFAHVIFSEATDVHPAPMLSEFCNNTICFGFVKITFLLVVIILHHSITKDVTFLVGKKLPAKVGQDHLKRVVYLHRVAEIFTRYVVLPNSKPV